ncbi:S8 family serine peptidase [Roseicyclus persicicus]|uniref:S8 family serine peptidase n=1 Tax=Roseicyclus persicicus TaxID=2650661 RepID=A0A7X6K0E7_9RHOB|nr:S8 family serine peptidase [Roseibacterium persicicum]
MSFASNPLYSLQWHFNLIGDIEAVWADYSGYGVVVAVYDDGVEQTHADLDGNYDESLELPYDDGDPNSQFDGHGTACAGIIAAENNGEGGIGVAWGATITSVDFLEDVQVGPYLLQSFYDMANYDIVSNSWGTYGFSSSVDISNPGWAQDEAIAVGIAVATGRGGLGTIIVKAAGNDALTDNPSAQNDHLNVPHEVISVAATDINGDTMNYSNWGVNLLIAAPAASVTTDLTGSAGYDPGDYTDSFGGTSAATPVVSGVIALMLEANPDLGWRDVQQILAMSASHTGSAFGSGAAGFEDGAWFSNGAGTWNGGGLTYHINYGYGMIDALAAVRLAEVWSIIHGPAQTTANMDFYLEEFASSTVSLALNDFSTITHTLNVTTDIDIEYLYVQVDLTHNYSGALTIVLVAPDGTEFELMDGNGAGATFNGYTFGVAAALGMSSLGQWTLSITDTDGFGDFGTLTGFTLAFNGETPDNNDVYTFTDDYVTYAAFEAARGSIADLNGGVDWLNFAAVTTGVFVDLVDSFAFGGSGPVAIAGVFENVATGDGNDTIHGNSLGNMILLGRGDDYVEGLEGNDTIDGGAGNDTLIDGTGDDSVYGGAGDDVLYNTSGSDTYDGGDGFDTMFVDVSSVAAGTYILEVNFVTGYIGRLGNPILSDTIVNIEALDFIGSVNVVMTGDANDNWVRTGSGHDSIRSGAGDDTVHGGAGSDTIWGEAGNDLLEGGDGNDVLHGQRGEDHLIGGSGRDWLFGYAEDDRLEGGDDGDRLYGMPGHDWLDGGDGRDWLFGNGGRDTIHGGGDNDQVYGLAGHDVLFGDAGNDRVFGGGGNDTLDGGAGNDTLTGDIGADVFVFGEGLDVITDFKNDVDEIHLDDAMWGGGLTVAQVISAFGSVVGGNTVLDFGGGNTLTINGLTNTSLLLDDIVIV